MEGWICTSTMVFLGFSLVSLVLGILLVSLAIEGRHGIVFLFKMLRANLWETQRFRKQVGGWQFKAEIGGILATACLAFASVLVSATNAVLITQRWIWTLPNVILGLSLVPLVLGILLISMAIEGKDGITTLFRVIRARSWEEQRVSCPEGWDVKTQTAAILGTTCLAFASVLVSASGLLIALG